MTQETLEQQGFTLFTVIQFVPDPIANERINVGIIVYTNDTIKIHFSSNLKRLEHFADPEKVEFFRDFQQDLVSCLEGDRFSDRLSRVALDQMIQKWTNLIQFTKPRGSLLEPEPLLKQMIHRFLPAEN